MVTTELVGGMANQMFCYAAGRALSIRLMTDLQLNVSKVEADPIRDYGLGCFREITAPIVRESKGRIIEHWGMDYDAEKWAIFPGDVTIRGYFQSEKYFKDCEQEIRKDFTFTGMAPKTNHTLADILAAEDRSVSLHVRRGDYLTPEAMKVIGIVDTEYYWPAIKAIVSEVPNTHFFIFSDDTEFIKASPLARLPEAGRTIVEGFKNFEDMWLMSRCKHHIIANSSFSWWGAWLSDQSGITIAPKKWLVSIPTKDLCPPSWIRI